jgi:hypothetical protein
MSGEAVVLAALVVVLAMTHVAAWRGGYRDGRNEAYSEVLDKMKEAGQ